MVNRRYECVVSCVGGVRAESVGSGQELRHLIRDHRVQMNWPHKAKGPVRNSQRIQF